MKNGIKLIILWIASLVLFAGAGITILVASDWMSGVHGLAIRFFLGYCAIIVVAQVFAVMEVIRRLREDSSVRNSQCHADIESAGPAEIQ